MTHTPVLVGLIGFLSFFVLLIYAVQTYGPKQTDETVATVRLCKAYFEYLDNTHKMIDAFDKLCWRPPNDPFGSGQTLDRRWLVAD
jgi:hypothetical protein